mgnify:CR=1 FL=1
MQPDVSPSSPGLSLVTCREYQRDLLTASIDRAVEPFGGWETLVQPGQTVFLKPNLLSARSPEAAATTHPLLVELVAQACRNRGAEVFIGDSPPLVERRIEEYWKNTGMKDAARRTGSHLIALEKEPRREISIPGPDGPLRIHVTEWLYRADVTINLPKLKTHNLTRITGAMKNHYGLLPGLQKAQLHRRFPRPDEFSRLCVEICRATPMSFSILDAIQGMDGQGPVGGRPIPIGALLASPDPVLVDQGICAITGLEPERIPMLAWCLQSHFATPSLRQANLYGDPIETLRFSGFNCPPLSPLASLPESLARLARRLVWMRPNLKTCLCIRCGTCARICPAHSIGVRGTGIRFDRKTCISCFCCMEVCPKDAIEMQTSPLLSLALLARKYKRAYRKRREG